MDGEGNTTRYEYGANGQLLRVTDSLGYCEEYHYDLGDRLCRMTDRNGIETPYAYNYMDCITMVTDPLGNVRATLRDTEGNVLKEMPPNAYWRA